ncbi:hypothetical protein SOVF_036220, partial [Spinacia oleracea]
FSNTHIISISTHDALHHYCRTTDCDSEGFQFRTYKFLLLRVKSIEKSFEIDQLKHALEVADYEKWNCEDLVKSKLDVLSPEHILSFDKIEKLQTELNTCRIKEQEQASTLSIDMQLEHNSKEMTKLRMRIQSTEARRVSFKKWYEKALDEQKLMHKKVEALGLFCTS